MTDRERTCDYVARKEDPSNWHGDDPDDWVLENEAPLGLEQEAWKCPHDALNGEEYCTFHTDPEDVPDHVDEGERFVEAVNEASAVDDEETARRRKEFVGATFGAFDIEEATLDAGDKHPIRLDNARFMAGVRADEAVFEHGFLATRARFETGDGGVSGEIGKVSFTGAAFSGDSEVSFSGAMFSGDGEVSFGSAEFSGDGDVSFSSAEFNGVGEVSFGLASFCGDGEVSFEQTEFRGEEGVSFWSTAFSGDGKVSFTSAEFSGGGEVSFAFAEFSGGGSVSFSSVRFNGDSDVSFESAEFSGDGEVSFGSAEFSSDTGVSFEWAVFGGREGVSFLSAEFTGGEVSFEDSSFETECFCVNAWFDADTDIVFANTEFEDTVTFETVEDETVRYVRGNFDFSGAVFRDKVRFRSRETPPRPSEEADTDEDPQHFDLVFADSVDFSDTTFQQGVDFSRTLFPNNTDFSGADLTGANFTGADLTGVNFERALLTRTELLGANLARTKLYGALLGDARINRGTDFWLDGDDTRREPDGSPSPVLALRRLKMTFRDQEPYCSYDPRYRGSDGEPNLEKAGEVYATLETLARDNSLPGLASECFLGRKDVQLREYWRDDNPGMVVRSLTPNLVARYGESPARVLGTGAVTVLACGLAYDTFDLVEHAGSGNPATLFESLYFSGLTFTTLGYGDFTPANGFGQVLAVAETSMGVVLLAILVFVFGRRATR